MVPHSQFYAAYLNNHFLIRTKEAARLLSMSENEINLHIKQLGLEVNHIEYIKTVKIDLLQSFYQSAETLFGLMHSLENRESNTAIPDFLVKAKISDLHKYIKSFKSFDHCYNYLKDDLKNFSDKSIPLYQWLFYLLTVVATNFPDNYVLKLNDDNNIKGIALLLNKAADLFNSEAHNSIKHGLRCILIEKFNINIDAPEIEGFELPEELKKFSGERDVLMYYAPVKGNEVATQVLVPLNVEEIIYYAVRLNKLQHNLINDRDILFNNNKPESVSSYFFNYNDLLNVQFDDNSNFKEIRIGPPL